MNRKSLVAFIGGVILVSLLVLAGCTGAPAAPLDSTDAPLTRPAPAGPALTSIEASPDSFNLVVGETQKIVVTANFADGSSQTITGQCDYFKSDNQVVATATVAGVVTAIAPGTATITISYTKNNVTQTTNVSLDVFPKS